jgi:methoxymalonate biosynthesis acyl carrier protein
VSRPVDGSAEERLLAFLRTRTRLDWEPDRDLFASGVVSSLFALELVVYLEKTFDIAVTGQHLSLDNFRTVDAMAALVRRIRADGTDG